MLHLQNTKVCNGKVKCGTKLSRSVINLKSMTLSKLTNYCDSYILQINTSLNPFVIISDNSLKCSQSCTNYFYCKISAYILLKVEEVLLPLSYKGHHQFGNDLKSRCHASNQFILEVSRNNDMYYGFVFEEVHDSF